MHIQPIIYCHNNAKDFEWSQAAITILERADIKQRYIQCRSVTFSIIHPLHAFSNAISHTAVQQLWRIQLIQNIAWSLYNRRAFFLYLQGEPKNGPFLTVDNFAMVNGRKARDMSKVAKFYPVKV